MTRASFSTTRTVRKGEEPAGPLGKGFRGLVRKTVYLNLGILISGGLIGLMQGPKGAVIVLALAVPAISFLLWTVTFAVSGIVWICRIFVVPQRTGRRPLSGRTPRGGIDDAWLDGPV